MSPYWYEMLYVHVHRQEVGVRVLSTMAYMGIFFIEKLL